MERDLLFFDQFQFESNGVVYECFKFVDLITLKVLIGTNLTQEELTKGKIYKGKIKIVSYGGKDKVKVSEIKA